VTELKAPPMLNSMSNKDLMTNRLNTMTEELNAKKPLMITN